MFANIYKKLVIDFSKITLLFLAIVVCFSLYQTKNFNLDASSDALVLDGDEAFKTYRKNYRYYD